MASNIPITTGSGQASVATEQIGANQYQIIKVVGGETGSTSVMGVNPDRSINVSVIGTVNTSGSVIALITGTPSISGAVTVVGKPSISGAVEIVGTNSSVITVWKDSSVLSVPVGSVITVWQNSSIISYQGGTQITSLVSTVPSSVIVGASIFGALPAGNAIIGAVAASISGTVTVTVTGTPSISGAVFVAGSVQSQQTGTVITSIVSSIPSSVLVGASIFGQLPAGTAPLGSVATLQGTNPWVVTEVGSVIAVLQSSSIIAINAGSVVALSSGSVITVWKDSSVLSVPVGSVITVLQAPSIVGTYAEDAAHTTADKGVFSLNVRNDTLASVTSADGDYGALSIGPAGEGIVANAPITKWVQGTADYRQGNAGASIVAIAAGGSSVFTYITGVQVANMGSASVLVTLASGGSILGYTIAPAGGGSNIVYPNGLKTPANFGFAASLSGIASVLVSAQGFISKT